MLEVWIKVRMYAKLHALTVQFLQTENKDRCSLVSIDLFSLPFYAWIG